MHTSLKLGMTACTDAKSADPRGAGFMMSPRSGLKSGVLCCGERGTGLDQGEAGFLPGGPRDRRAGLVALSSLFLGISVLLRGVPASHRTGSKTASKMRLFWGQSSHFVPFCPIHFYLVGACETCLEGRSAECRRVDLSAMLLPRCHLALGARRKVLLRAEKRGWDRREFF